VSEFFFATTGLEREYIFLFPDRVAITSGLISPRPASRRWSSYGTAGNGKPPESQVLKARALIPSIRADNPREQYWSRRTILVGL